jgi:hypothetical protein
MRRIVCALAAATLTCAAANEACQAAPIVSSHRHGHSHRYIVIPLTRDYGWWPQGQYRWFPFGLARWGYWCEPASYHRLSCGVGE